jgi:transcriptional regulator with XRE-family HTH domain
MVVGERLRALREQKGLSQSDLEDRSGMARTYVSRVEQGHTVPSLETLERFAGALEVPLYRLFYEGGSEPVTPHLTKRRSLEELAVQNGLEGGEGLLKQLKDLTGKMVESDRAILLDFACRLVTR